MREILFRGKRKDNGEWVEGYCVCVAEEYHYILTGRLDIYRGNVQFEGDLVIPESVSQFCGLCDNNGNMIFEGDIVDILTENEEIGVVAYEDGGFLVNADGFSVDFHSNINGTDLEVIGNIHDNPELLRKEDEGK